MTIEVESKVRKYIGDTIGWDAPEDAFIEFWAEEGGYRAVRVTDIAWWG